MRTVFRIARCARYCGASLLATSHTFPRLQVFTITDSNSEVRTDEDVQRLSPNATLWAIVRESSSHMEPIRASPST